MPEDAWLELSIAVYRDGDALTAVARMGAHELARAEGVDLSDVLASLGRATARVLK